MNYLYNDGCRDYYNHSCLINYNIGCSVESMEYDLKNRRTALGISQATMAKLVEKRAGEAFTQQAYSKAEKPGAKSAFMHHILAVLGDLEGNSNPLADKFNRLSPEDRLAAERFVDAMLASRDKDGPSH